VPEHGAALLVDGDNVPPEVLAPLVAKMEEHGPVTERRIFRNWRSSRQAEAWDAASKRYAFERVDRYRTSAGKNASDIALVVHAMDLLHAGVRRFCIASGDTDFAPLVERLRRAGSHVTLVGHKGDGGVLATLADEYLDFPQLVRSGGRAGGRPAPKTPQAKAAAPKPSSNARGRSEPKPRGPAKRASAPKAKPAPAKAQPKPSGAAGLDALRSVLLDSYEVARTDGEVDQAGWVAVDRLGQIARSVDPQFKLSKYGLGSRTSLTSAFERVGAPFQVREEGRGGNRQYLVRRA